MERLTLEDYKKFGGRQSDFPTLLIDAELYLDKVTFGRIDKLDSSIKRCLVLLIDEIAKKRDGIASYSNGFENWSYNKDLKERMYNICKSHIKSELLFRGVQ